MYQFLFQPVTGVDRVEGLRRQIINLQ